MRFADGAAVVRDRSGGLCESCRRAGVQTHHRQARGMGGVHRGGTAVNRASCLVRLCVDCHGWVESYRTAAEVLGLLVPRPADPAERPVWLHTVYGRGWWLLSDAGDYTWCDLPEPAGDTPPGRVLRSA